MKKFSKINESYVQDPIVYNIPIEISPEISNMIIDEILEVWEDKNLLKLYGYEKAVNKVVSEYFKDYMKYSMDDFKYNISIYIEENDFIEQLFLDDFTLPPGEMARIMKKINQ